MAGSRALPDHQLRAETCPVVAVAEAGRAWSTPRAVTNQVLRDSSYGILGSLGAELLSLASVALGAGKSLFGQYLVSRARDSRRVHAARTSGAALRGRVWRHVAWPSAGWEGRRRRPMTDQPEPTIAAARPGTPPGPSAMARPPGSPTRRSPLRRSRREPFGDAQRPLPGRGWRSTSSQSVFPAPDTFVEAVP